MAVKTVLLWNSSIVLQGGRENCTTVKLPPRQAPLQLGVSTLHRSAETSAREMQSTLFSRKYAPQFREELAYTDRSPHALVSGLS